MKTKKLRLVSALLALAMLFALLPTAAFAAEDNKCGDNLTWKLENGTLTISGEGAMYDYTTPADRPWNNRRTDITTVVIEGGVTTIGKYALGGLPNLTTADMSKAMSLKTIRDGAFADCEKLDTVNLPKNGVLETIDYWAFSYHYGSKASKIEKIVIPASVKEIGAYAFRECSKLTTVTFAPDSQLELINGSAFQGTALTEIKIPASVKIFDYTAFNNCGYLKEVTFEAPSGLCGENGYASGKLPVFDGCTALEKVYCEQALREKLVGAGVNGDIIKTYPSETDDTPKTDPDTNPKTYAITIDYGTAYDADGNKIAEAAKGDVVTIEANETAFDGMTFEYWKDHNGNVKLENDHAAKTRFAMPEGEVHLEAIYQAADNDDTSWDAATVVTGVAVSAGTAILAYHIGTELYAEQVLGKGVPVPKTRADVALLAWQLAGEPAVELNGEPLSEAAQAERWAVESGLMHSDADGSFNGAKKMSKLKALRTLSAAKKLG